MSRAEWNGDVLICSYLCRGEKVTFKIKKQENIKGKEKGAAKIFTDSPQKSHNKATGKVEGDQMKGRTDDDVNLD